MKPILGKATPRNEAVTDDIFFELPESTEPSIRPDTPPAVPIKLMR